jgi:hypothetical protein
MVFLQGMMQQDGSVGGRLPCQKTIDRENRPYNFETADKKE